MTSLKAKIQLKSDLKKSQKKRRDKVIDQLKTFESMENEEQFFFWKFDQKVRFYETVKKTPKIHEMMALTSHQSIGVDLRELIHDKTEKKANILQRDRLRRQDRLQNLQYFSHEEFLKPKKGANCSIPRFSPNIKNQDRTRRQAYELHSVRVSTEASKSSKNKKFLAFSHEIDIYRHFFQ